VRDWDNGERAGTSVEIEAESIGHDLVWGSSVFTRTVLQRDTETQDASVAVMPDESGQGSDLDELGEADDEDSAPTSRKKAMAS
jgi:single-strand DNA-binding protein